MYIRNNGILKIFFFFLAARAKTSFENLKKNYTKKRSNFRNSQRSGTSRDAVDSAEQELKKMSFLVWLDDFIRPRSSKSSFDDSESLLEGNQEEHRIFTEEDGDIGEEPDETEFLGDDDSYCMSPNIVEGTPKINSTFQHQTNEEVSFNGIF